jgi:hypothetical protein
MNTVTAKMERQLQQTSSNASGKPLNKQQLAERVAALSNKLMLEAVPVFTTYTNDFVKKWGDELETFTAELAERLIRNRITPEGFRQGLERFKMRCVGDNRWMINPQEFAELCKPTGEDLGFPKFDDCIDELMVAQRHFRVGKEYVFSHRVIELMYGTLGFTLRTEPHEVFVDMAKKEYRYWTEKAQRDGLPQPRALIESKVKPKPPVACENALESHTDKKFVSRLNSLREAIKQRGKGEAA